MVVPPLGTTLGVEDSPGMVWLESGESVHCELCSGARGAEKVTAVIFIVTRFINKDEWQEIKASEDV